MRMIVRMIVLVMGMFAHTNYFVKRFVPKPRNKSNGGFC
jgi:hypothetical protein